MSIAEAITARPPKRRMERRAPLEAGGSMADIVAPLAAKGRISKRSMWGAHMLIADLQADGGRSGSHASRYAERVQTSYRDHGQMSGWTAAQDRVQSVLNLLDTSERQLLDFLIRNKEYDRSGLADWGRQRANYADDKLNGAYTVGRIDGLLERIASLYSRYAHVP